MPVDATFAEPRRGLRRAVGGAGRAGPATVGCAGWPAELGVGLPGGTARGIPAGASPRSADLAREAGPRRPDLVDMEVIVRLQNLGYCASITCMIRHYVARRAQVIEDHPHNADERASGLPVVLGRDMRLELVG